MTRPLVTAGPIERNFIPAKVPLDIGSGFGVGDAAGVGDGLAVGDGDGSVCCFESCWANKCGLKNKIKPNVKIEKRD